MPRGCPSNHAMAQKIRGEGGAILLAAVQIQHGQPTRKGPALCPASSHLLLRTALCSTLRALLPLAPLLCVCRIRPAHAPRTCSSARRSGPARPAAGRDPSQWESVILGIQPPSAPAFRIQVPSQQRPVDPAVQFKFQHAPHPSQPLVISESASAARAPGPPFGMPRRHPSESSIRVICPSHPSESSIRVICPPVKTWGRTIVSSKFIIVLLINQYCIYESMMASHLHHPHNFLEC